MGLEITGRHTGRLVLCIYRGEGARSRSQERIFLYHLDRAFPDHNPELEGWILGLLIKGIDPLHDRGTGQDDNYGHDKSARQGGDQLFPGRVAVRQEDSSHEGQSDERSDPAATGKTED